MSVTLIGEGQNCRLVFEGALTFEFSSQLEDRIIEALRRFSHFEVDLSGVREIDLCGIHLLGVLQNVGGERVEIVAPSPVVDQASSRLLASSRSARLFGAARRAGAVDGA